MNLIVILFRLSCILNLLKICISSLKRSLNVIKAKIKTIQSNNRENEQKLIEFRSGDIVSFWLVNALNTAHATLNHLLQYPHIHPERLFFELLRLTGSLLTFSTAHEVDHLPRYQHHNLQESFSQLDVILRELLDTIISNRYISIQLKRNTTILLVRQFRVRQNHSRFKTLLGCFKQHDAKSRTRFNWFRYDLKSAIP